MARADDREKRRRERDKERERKRKEKERAREEGDEEPRPVWQTALLWTGVLIVGREAWLALYTRRNRRRDAFNLAQFRARESGKQLIVVGDPDKGIVNRFIGRDYDCGDLCLDEHGCLECDQYITGKLAQTLATLPDNSAVIYVSGVLEQVHDMDQVLYELHRVSGGDVYVVNVEPWTLTAWLYPGNRRRISQAPPEYPTLRWKPIPWSPNKSVHAQYQFTPGTLPAQAPPATISGGRR